AKGVNLTTLHQRTFWKISFVRIVLFASIPVFLLGNCVPPQIRLPVTATAAETTTHAATSTTHATGETTVHASSEAGLPAEGVLAYHATVVKSAERAGVTALLHVGHSESTIGAMVEIASKIVTMEIAAVGGESVAVVEKGMAPGNKPYVIKNHKATAPVATPRGPSPSPTKTPADGKPYSERDDRRGNPGSWDVTRINY